VPFWRFASCCRHKRFLGVADCNHSVYLTP
jgi:hypothetical protein